MIRSAALAVTLFLALALAWAACKTPPAAPMTTVKTAFSAERAMADVREIARDAHPLESADHARVRDWLADRLRRLGLQVRLQKTAVATVEHYGERTVVLGGEVENIIAVLPGQNPALPAVVVEAHYDSVPNSPGAADDGAGVASAIETARALIAEGKPKRDVIFVITDGEEDGLLGAHAFWEQDPLASHAGFVLNMDTRGAGGRAFMFETGKGDGQAIALFRKVTPRPASNSLAVFLYEHMPNGTDFTIPKTHGVPGLNYAFIGRPFDYHSASATPQGLDIGALQHMGEQVLAAARATAFSDTLPGKAPDVVYADLFGAAMLAYTPATGWLVLLVAAALGGFAAVRAWRRGEIAPVEVARGALASLSLLLFAAALMALVRSATGIGLGFVDQRPLLAQFPLFEAALGLAGLGAILLYAGAFPRGGRWRAALVVLAIGLVAALVCRSTVVAGLAAASAFLALGAFWGPSRPWSLVSGFLLTGLIVSVVVQVLAPTTDFLFAWPLLAACAAALAASFAGRFERPAALLASGLTAVPTLGWVLAQAHGVTLGVGADIPMAVGLFVWLCAPVLLPLALATPRGGAAGAGALLLAGLAVAFMGLHDPFTARHPRPTEVLYVRDDDHNKAWRAALTPWLDPWSRKTLLADGGALRKQALSPLTRGKAVWVTDAPAVDAPKAAPQLTDATGGVSIALPVGAWTEFDLSARDGVQGVSVQDRSYPLVVKPHGRVYVIWHSPQGGSPAASTLALKGTGPLQVRYAVITQGWPTAAGPPPKRPAAVTSWGHPDSTSEIGTIKAVGADAPPRP